MAKLLIASICWILLYHQVGMANSPPLPTYSVKYDVNSDPFEDGYDALTIAKKSQRKVLIEVGGEWCLWCHKLDQFLHGNAQVYQQLHQNFVLLKVNVSDVNDNQKFLAAFPKPLGYPHMYVSDSNGQLLHSQDTAEFLQGDNYSVEKFTNFINKWK